MSYVTINSVLDFPVNVLLQSNDVVLVLDDERTSGNLFIFDSSTTVYNNGTTYQAHANLGNGVWAMQYSGPINAKWFGAIGDAINDDTYALQQALNYASSQNADLYLPESKIAYATSSQLTALQGLKSFKGPGKIRYIGHSPNVIILVLRGSDNNTLSDCVISIAEIDGSGNAKGCIFLEKNNENITIDNIKMKGLRDPDIITGTYGIKLHESCNNNRFTNNIIELNEVDPNFSMQGISIIGLCNYTRKIGNVIYNYTSPDGYYFEPEDNHFTRFPISCSKNIITNNVIYNGNHGLFIHCGTENIISENLLINQRDRSIILSSASYNNTVTANNCIGFGSSGIHLCYNVSENLIASNNVYSPTSTGEGGIQAYVGCCNNVIEDNKITTGSHYGIYIAISSSLNNINGNYLTGFSLAGIAIESDWNQQSHLPALAIFSRPNFGNPPFIEFENYQWAKADCKNNVISNNTIFKENNTNVAAIYLAAVIGANFNMPYSVVDTFITNNIVNSKDFDYYLYLFQDDYTLDEGCFVSGITLNNNSFFTSSKDKFYLQYGRSHFFEIENNSEINNGIIQITGTTPDVSIGDIFLCVNQDTTDITYFIRGKSGQQIIVKLDKNTNIIHDTHHIILKNGQDVNGYTNFVMSFVNIDNIWFELSRNF